MQKVESALGGDEPKCGIQPSPIPIVDNPTALSSHARGWQHRRSYSPLLILRTVSGHIATTAHQTQRTLGNLAPASFEPT